MNELEELVRRVERIALAQESINRSTTMAINGLWDEVRTTQAAVERLSQRLRDVEYLVNQRY